MIPTLGKIFAILLGFYFLFKTYNLVKKRRENLFEFAIWSFLGLSLILFSLFPQLSQGLSNLLGTRRSTNAIVLIAILILLFLTFFIFKRVRNLQYDVDKLNEELSRIKSPGEI
jgi:hypothetical protein